jgi:heptaprenyl diphosphate synthase
MRRIERRHRLSFLLRRMIALAVVILIRVFGDKISVILISVASAMAHNVGQLAVFAVIMGLSTAFYYFPFLMIMSVFLGIVTGIVLNVILPVIKKGGSL